MRVGRVSETITFGRSLHADSKYVIGFVLGCREVPQTIHFLFSESRKKSPPPLIGIAHFFQAQSRIAAKMSISVVEEEEIAEKERRYRVFFTMRRSFNFFWQKRFFHLCLNECIHSIYIGIIGTRKSSTLLLSYQRTLV